MNQIQKLALKNAFLTSLYIALVVTFMNWASSIKIEKANEFLAPILFLMIFVLSASVTGFLILGKPAQMYVDGKKKEALSLLFHTLAFFGAITIFLIIILLFIPR